MGNLEGVKVGDRLLRVALDHRWRGGEPPSRLVTVHKVGRSLVHILQHGRPVTYRIENGVGTDTRDGELWTPEDWTLEAERDGLEEALRHHGLEVRPGRAKPVPMLKKILALLEEESGAQGQ
jgi:hypothetical protein